MRRRLKNILKTAILIAVSVIVGMWLQLARTSKHANAGKDDANDALTTSQSATVWTCSMHPQIKLPKHGKCPICFMDLIPLEFTDNVTDGDRSLVISNDAAKLMELETVEVARRFVAAEIRLVGKVEYDETRISDIAAWVPGRLDRLYVNYIGVPVRKGDHLADIYSPSLLTAQEELLQAIKIADAISEDASSAIARSALATVQASREKLRLLGLSREQIDEIVASRKASDHITILSPRDGLVIEKSAQVGMYVETGSKIYRIADFSTVWVELEAYPSDLSWLRYGGAVEFATDTYPGKLFNGVIAFIAPTVDAATRTAKVRLTVDNAALKLKPGMFVRAVAKPRIGRNGQVLAENLQGKWICPMHPEVVKDGPEHCDICGMPLASAESLGYITEAEDNAPLVIPVTAALKTGKRAVVYRMMPDSAQPTYEGAEVVLGPRLGDFYIVENGLTEGDRVVTRGAFKLDAELQIQAKPSMMSRDNSTDSQKMVMPND